MAALSCLCTRFSGVLVGPAESTMLRTFCVKVGTVRVHDDIQSVSAQRTLAGDVIECIKEALKGLL